MNIKSKLKGKKAEMKEKIVGKLKGCEECAETVAQKAKDAAKVVGTVAIMLALCGCQSLIPSARSNQTSYDGMVKVGDNARIGTLSVTIGDGTLASADGGGDSQSNTPTQTVSPQTQLSYGIGTGGGSTWGEFFGSMSKLFGGGSTAAAATSTPAATTTPSANANCADGSCSEK